MANSVQLDSITVKAIIKAFNESDFVGGSNTILIECDEQTEDRLGVDIIKVYQVNECDSIKNNLILTNTRNEYE